MGYPIHTPPVEDFGKCTTGGVWIFKCTYPLCDFFFFFDQVYHRGSNFFIQICQKSLPTWNSHFPCVRCFSNLPMWGGDSNGIAQWLELQKFRVFICLLKKVFYTNIDCSWGKWWKIIDPRLNSTLTYYSPRPVGPRWIVGLRLSFTEGTIISTIPWIKEQSIFVL